MLPTSLRYFMTVVRCGSIRAASEELNIAQSAVSRRLQSLEWEVGAPLLERRPRGVVPTEAGDLLYAHALAMSFSGDRLRSELDELRGLKRGKVRVAAMEAMVPAVLSRSIHAFRERYPAVSFVVDVQTSDIVVERMACGDADIGLTYDGILRPEIEVRHTSPAALLAAMAPGHPLARRASLHVADLVRWPLAIGPARSGSRVFFERACAEAGLAVAPALETNSVELAHRFALAGNGVTLQLRHYAAEMVRGGQLVAVPFAADVFPSKMSVITLKGRKLPLAAERFVATLREALDDPTLPGAADARRS